MMRKSSMMLVIFLATYAGIAVIVFRMAPTGDHQGANVFGLANESQSEPFVLSRNRRLKWDGLEFDVAGSRKMMELAHYRDISMSGFLHLMRLHGPEHLVKLPDENESYSMLSVLTDSEVGIQWFGVSPVVATPNGARYPNVDGFGRSATLGQGSDSHRDHLLAVFAELSIPLAHPITIAGKTYSVRDVLKDSLADFDLGQREIAWSSFAYTIYIPECRRWTNRFGEQFDFNDLVSELTRRPMDGESCCGVHLCIAMTAIDILDQRTSTLTEESRRVLKHRLRSLAENAMASQMVNGSWPATWWTGAAASGRASLLASSHIMDWLLYLDEGFAVSDLTFERGCRWLAARIDSATPSEMRSDTCPYSHALFVLARAARTKKAVSATRSAVLNIAQVAAGY